MRPEFEALNRRFDGMGYLAHEDLWPALQQGLGIRTVSGTMRRLWVAAGIVLAWRSLQLLVNLPSPVVNLLIPLAVVVTALWQLSTGRAGDSNLAPELEKRGASMASADSAFWFLGENGCTLATMALVLALLSFLDRAGMEKAIAAMIVAYVALKG